MTHDECIKRLKDIKKHASEQDVELINYIIKIIQKDKDTEDDLK